MSSFAAILGRVSISKIACRLRYKAVNRQVANTTCHLES